MIAAIATDDLTDWARKNRALIERYKEAEDTLRRSRPAVGNSWENAAEVRKELGLEVAKELGFPTEGLGYYDFVRLALLARSALLYATALDLNPNLKK